MFKFINLKILKLLNLIGNQSGIDKIYLYKAKYQYLFTKTEGLGINQLICMMFTRILIITILIKKIKY